MNYVLSFINMKISRSYRFKRSYKKLPFHIQDDFSKRIKFFSSNPFESSLKTHKLRGNLDDYYAFYLQDGYRVLFEFENDNNVLLINIGSHDDYVKWGRG